jgi:hypothetical protein
MAKQTLIANPDHHFVKHCKNRELIREPRNGPIIGIYPEAFLLRPADARFPEEKWLSGLYYEVFDGTDAEKMCACCHFIPIEMKKKDALCKMKVGAIKDQGQKRGRSLRIFHRPEKDSFGYAALHGLPRPSEVPDDELTLLLATIAILETAEIMSIL